MGAIEHATRRALHRVRPTRHDGVDKASPGDPAGTPGAGFDAAGLPMAGAGFEEHETGVESLCVGEAR